MATRRGGDGDPIRSEVILRRGGDIVDGAELRRELLEWAGDAAGCSSALDSRLSPATLLRMNARRGVAWREVGDCKRRGM